ncbi:MAG TPA: CHASE2 domain-containing protein [Candidatus Sericytochromatia bacterium]
MGKLVVLKLGEGSFEQGFPVTLQIGEEGKHPSLEITGKLPSTPEIPQFYTGWATSYRCLGLRSRLEASKAQVTNVSKLENCYNAARILGDRLNAWLHSDSFRLIREKLLEQLMPSEEIRLIIQTENSLLRRLPWHLWDLCDRYPKVEIALSAPVYEQIEQISSPHPQVRILAILGNSAGINTQADRLLLEQLPDAEIHFMVEPQCSQLTDELWKQGWDILFFAGHSSSQPNAETGRIYINQTDSLTIDQLRYALKKAVKRGLKIAIFNSCDGLGLANNLADLQIPQIIIMREPVPDQVAQAFLKYFLETFARGESFYLSVREARERLQGWEDQFPCATWLPMIFQNPAILPSTWQELYGDSQTAYISPPSPPPAISPSPHLPIPPSPRRGFAKVVFISLAVTSLLIGVRQVGILQPIELQAFDHLIQRRPAEVPDSRLLVVTVTEADIQAQKNEPRRGSLSDRSLTRLLDKLESYQPRAIGLDIYRDFPVSSEYPDLAKRLLKSDRLIAVCKASTEINDQGVPPPPEVPAEHLGFSDVVTDPDGILRRHLLALTPSPASACTASYALSSRLAFRYLAAQKIFPTFTKEGYLQLGKTVFKRLKAQTGGYQNIDAWGHQVLLNYRYYRSSQNFAPQVTLTQVLNGQLNPNAVKDRAVLIGVTAPSAKDYFFTPYSTARKFDQQMPGVVVQAQMVSQILSAVLDGRSLLWVWPVWGEVLWIWGWSLTGALVSWRFHLWIRSGLVAIAVVVLYGLCFALLTQGGWVPLVPAALALVCTSVSVVVYSTLPTQRKPSTLVI